MIEPEADKPNHGITERLSPSSDSQQHETVSKPTNYSASDGSPSADSLRSNHISIVSLNEDDDSSSLADSDSDLDDIHTNVPAFIAEAIRNGAPPNIPSSSNGMIVINNGGGGSSSVSDMVSSGMGNGRPNIGSIALQNSSDITFGDKTFYQGPVTVKQFFLEKDRWRTMEGSGVVNGGASGYENGAFEPNEANEKKERNGKLFGYILS